MSVRILVGLVMLIPGILKLFGDAGFLDVSGVVGMLSGIVLFSWAPSFWAWVLILSEIVFGIAILANYKLKYTVIPPVIILLVATFFVQWGRWSSFLLHLLAVAVLLDIGYDSKHK